MTILFVHKLLIIVNFFFISIYGGLKKRQIPLLHSLVYTNLDK